jgi:hypothetical protein
MAIESLDRALSFGAGTHLDKPKTLGSASKFVGDHPGGLDGAVLGKEFLQLLIGGGVRQASYVNFIPHILLLQENAYFLGPKIKSWQEKTSGTSTLEFFSD